MTGAQNVHAVKAWTKVQLKAMPGRRDREARARSELASRPVTPPKATAVTRAATTDRPGHVGPGTEAHELRSQVRLPRLANPDLSDRRFLFRVGNSLVHRAFSPGRAGVLQYFHRTQHKAVWVRRPFGIVQEKITAVTASPKPTC